MPDPLFKFFQLAFSSFPLRLLLLHLKKNHLIIFLWMLLISIVCFGVGKIIGLPYLFLDPEYLNKVGVASFALMGVATGVFVMSFHISSYIQEAERFRFLALQRFPFLLFAWNNSLLPTLFVLAYGWRIYAFQQESGLVEASQAWQDTMAFLGAFVMTLVAFFGYFMLTNTRYFKAIAAGLDFQFRRNIFYRLAAWRRQKDWVEHPENTSGFFNLRGGFSRHPHQPEQDFTEVYRVFTQHHLNAIFIIVLFLCLLFMMGYFSDSLYFAVPAGASILLLLSILLLSFGAVYYWLRGWAHTFTILLAVGYNSLLYLGVFKSDNYVYGVDYTDKLAAYQLSALRETYSKDQHLEDRDSTVVALNNWKAKQAPIQAKEKPVMVILNVSGGGQRSAAWTLRVLQKIDSSLGGQGILDRTMLITGASGGLIGAAYYRELYLKRLLQDSLAITTPFYYRKIAADVLNPVAFMAVTNDLFYRYHRFEYGGFAYPKDRGTAFEQQLNRNLDGVFDKTLGHYRLLEKSAAVPMLLISPTITNDGRRLYISPMNVSYLCSIYTKAFRKIQGIEFRSLFQEQQADNLRFSSALRMSATFPYITPNPILPSQPTMEIMDAGIVDNFGVSDALKFLYEFRAWVRQNTSGVLFVKIRDSGKEPDIKQNAKRTFYTKLTNPLRTIYHNMFTSQDNFNDLRIETTEEWLGVPVEEATFQYLQTSADGEKSERAALSWHLTEKEKRNIYSTTERRANLYALKTVLENLAVEKKN